MDHAPWGELEPSDEESSEEEEEEESDEEKPDETGFITPADRQVDRRLRAARDMSKMTRLPSPTPPLHTVIRTATLTFHMCS